MIDFFNWCWEQLGWLIGLAKPQNLRTFVDSLGHHWWWSYAILAAIIFSETGLLVGFFLPGDSLLFAAGFLASQDVLNIVWLNVILSIAAVVGDAVNYQLGRWMDKSVLEHGRIRFVKRKHLMAAKEFYDRYGGIAIVLARFAPLVRTFTPFVAGVAGMGYRQFVVYNIVGGVSWVASMTLAGYWLGRIPFVADHFELVVLGIIAVSLMPIIIAVAQKVFRERTTTPAATADATVAPGASQAGRDASDRPME